MAHGCGGGGGEGRGNLLNWHTLLLLSTSGNSGDGVTLSRHLRHTSRQGGPHIIKTRERDRDRHIMCPFFLQQGMPLLPPSPPAISIVLGRVLRGITPGDRAKGQAQEKKKKKKRNARGAPQQFSKLNCKSIGVYTQPPSDA